MMCPSVHVNFSVSPLEICMGDSFEIVDLSSGFCNNFDYDYTWDYSGGATNQILLSISTNTLPMPSFYKTFTSSGVYWIKLRIDWSDPYTSQWGYLIDSVEVIVHDSVIWGNIQVLSDYTCDSVFLVTDSSFNLESSWGMPQGYPNGIFWKFFDYNNPAYPVTFYTNPGDIQEVVTYPFTPNTPLPAGQYYLTMAGQNFCGNTIYDSINFFITGGTPIITGTQQVCVGDTALFEGSSGCPEFWQWTFGDGTSNLGSNTVYHIYSQLGTYQVALQTNSGGVLGYHTIEVIQAQTPIIAGYKNNCDYTVLYSIDNFDTNYTYTWSTQVFDQSSYQYTTGQFIINGSSNVETANTANIDWTTSSFPGLPDYVLITVEAHLIGSNCSAISTMKITKCCSFKGYGLLHDTIIYSDTAFTNVNNLIINGIVTFSGGVTFDNSSILLGPLAKIIVDNSSKFEAINTTFQSKECLYMNDGIYAETQNDTIVFRSNSGLTSSINGLCSSNGAYLRADSSAFFNNLIGIQILDHKQVLFPIPPPAFTPGDYSITNCDFGVTYNPLQVLTYPYNGVQPLTGINIKNVQGVIIGDSLLGGNTFSKLRAGITIYNSKVNIYNNQFTGIENFMGPAPVSEAAISINSLSVFEMENIGDVVIGSSANSSKNVFDSCEISVYSNNSKLLIKNNVFKYGHQSIDVYNFKNGTNIENNRFKDINFGIKFNNLLGVNRKLDIYNNFFEGQADNSYSLVSREAMNLINCNSQVNSSIRAKVANNTIRFAGQKYSIASGIRVQNCDGILVNSNHIARSTSIPIINADWDKTIGIRVATSQGAQITDNYIYGFGQSITTYGNLTGTQFSCNELRIYKYGFYWSLFTSLSHQGRAGSSPQLLGLNTHNYWASLPSINGTEQLAQGSSADNIQNTTPVRWYHFSSLGSQYIPNSVNNTIPTLKIKPIANDSAIHQCAGGSGPNGSGTSTGGGTPNGGSSTVMSLIENIDDPELRDFMFEDLLQGEEYTDLQNEYRAYDADFLYKMLADDTTMMWLGGTKDADYRYFFDSIQEANIGQFTDVYNLIDAGDFEEAIALNNAIIPEQDIFVNLKTTLGIYLSTWCLDNYSLTTTEYETLYSIASQTPYEGGDAVYTARIMIGFEPDEEGVVYRIAKPIQANLEDELVLYPNPASDQLTIEFTNDKFEEVSANLKVYTITGSLIYTKQFNTNNSFEVVSVKDLKNGVYIYHISLSNGMDKSGKLVILKQ